MLTRNCSDPREASVMRQELDLGNFAGLANALLWQPRLEKWSNQQVKAGSCGPGQPIEAAADLPAICSLPPAEGCVS
jgi:hypothetical protein